MDYGIDRNWHDNCQCPLTMSNSRDIELKNESVENGQCEKETEGEKRIDADLPGIPELIRQIDLVLWALFSNGKGKGENNE